MLKVFVSRCDAYELLARAVKVTWGWDKLPGISRLPRGKPVFPDYEDCHFNLSHSYGMALCALSDKPVGADLEVIRPYRNGLPERLLRGTDDYPRFLSLGGDPAAFFTVWTERESIVKFTGEGLRGLRQEHIPEGCVISHLAGQDWVASICSSEQADAQLKGFWNGTQRIVD